MKDTVKYSCPMCKYNMLAEVDIEEIANQRAYQIMNEAIEEHEKNKNRRNKKV